MWVFCGCVKVPTDRKSTTHFFSIFLLKRLNRMKSSRCAKKNIIIIVHPNTKKNSHSKQLQPGDSKWPFHHLFRGHLTIEKGHLTIPKRSQRIARKLILHVAPCRACRRKPRTSFGLWKHTEAQRSSTVAEGSSAGWGVGNRVLLGCLWPWMVRVHDANSQRFWGTGY